MTEEISIVPGSNIFEVFRHLNYKSHYALAEFVDNSVQSYVTNQAALYVAYKQNYVTVEITFDKSTKSIVIVDDAAGISKSDYSRAFRPATPPPDRKGLNEYGLGMKTAACWFSPDWEVESSAVGENVKRIILFDIKKIAEEKITGLPVREVEKDNDCHGTKVILKNVHHFPAPGTIKKIKKHLSDIYKIFIRNNQLKIVVNGEHLQASTPKPLTYRNVKPGSSSNELEWKRNVNIDIDEKKITGFVSVLESGSRHVAGIQVFRRGRGILGTGENLYRPVEIYGESNSFKSLRLYAEIHMDDFDVTQQKDSFTWEEFEDNESGFIEMLRTNFDKDPSYLFQADRYRSKEAVLQGGINGGQREEVLEALGEEIKKGLSLVGDIIEKPETIIPVTDLEPSVENSPVKIKALVNGVEWTVVVEQDLSDAPENMVAVVDKKGAASSDRNIVIRFYMNSRFVRKHLLPDYANLDSLMKLSSALALAQVIGEIAPSFNASYFVKVVNDILNKSFSGDD